MARNRTAVEDVETVDPTEVEDVDVVEADETEKPAKAPKAKKEPVRGDLPEGFVTPIGFAKILTERQLHTNRAGEPIEVRPQMVYSYIKNAPKDRPFPLQVITDSIGAERKVVQVDEGLAWWTDKNERVAGRKAAAAEKAEQKAARAAEKASKTEEVTEAEGESEVVEAE